MNCPDCGQAVADPYDHVNTYGPSYTCKKPHMRTIKAKPKRPAFSYSYDPRTEMFSMTAASLTTWLMDVEGRAKLERALGKFTTVPFDVEGVVV